MEGIKIKTESIVHPIDLPERINVASAFGNMEYVKPEDMSPEILLELCDRFTIDLFKAAGKEIPTRIVDGGAETEHISVLCEERNCIHNAAFLCGSRSIQLNKIGKCTTRERDV